MPVGVTVGNGIGETSGIKFESKGKNPIKLINICFFNIIANYIFLLLQIKVHCLRLTDKRSFIRNNSLFLLQTIQG